MIGFAKTLALALLRPLEPAWMRQARETIQAACAMADAGELDATIAETAHLYGFEPARATIVRPTDQPGDLEYRCWPASKDGKVNRRP